MGAVRTSVLKMLAYGRNKPCLFQGADTAYGCLLADGMEILVDVGELTLGCGMLLTDLTAAMELLGDCEATLSMTDSTFASPSSSVVQITAGDVVYRLAGVWPVETPAVRRPGPDDLTDLVGTLLMDDSARKACKYLYTAVGDKQSACLSIKNSSATIRTFTPQIGGRTRIECECSGSLARNVPSALLYVLSLWPCDRAEIYRSASHGYLVSPDRQITCRFNWLEKTFVANETTELRWEPECNATFNSAKIAQYRRLFENTLRITLELTTDCIQISNRKATIRVATEETLDRSATYRVSSGNLFSRAAVDFGQAVLRYTPGDIRLWFDYGPALSLIVAAAVE